jgi:hypothetical protein
MLYCTVRILRAIINAVVLKKSRDKMKRVAELFALHPHELGNFCSPWRTVGEISSFAIRAAVSVIGGSPEFEEAFYMYGAMDLFLGCGFRP